METSPNKSYVEALTGCPSPGLSRDRPTDDVNSVRGVIIDNLSILEECDANEESDLTERIQEPTPSITNLTTTIKIHKQSWTKDEQVDLYKCYCIAINKGLPVTKGTFEIWRKKFPTTHPNMTSNTLSGQRRYVQSNILTKSEMKKIEDETKGKETEAGTINTVTNNQVEDTVEIPQAENKNEPTKEMLEMKAMLLVKFEYIKTKNLEERAIPKKFVMTSENRRKIKCMNTVLTDLTETITKDITELNALHYAAAVTLAGVKEPKSSKPKSDFDPDKFVKESISKTRKWIGRLTAISKGSRLTSKVKKFLKKDKAETVLIRLKMKLAALCKKLRTRADSHLRFQSNRLYQNNQKAFYATLRNEDGVEISDPPTQDDIQK